MNLCFMLVKTVELTVWIEQVCPSNYYTDLIPPLQHLIINFIPYIYQWQNVKPPFFNSGSSSTDAIKTFLLIQLILFTIDWLNYKVNR